MCGDEESRSLFCHQRWFALFRGVGLRAKGNINSVLMTSEACGVCRIHYALSSASFVQYYCWDVIMFVFEDRDYMMTDRPISYSRITTPR